MWGVAFALAVGVGIATAETQYKWIGISMFGTALLVVFGGAYYMDRRRDQIAHGVGVICSACGEPLLQTNAKWALTTGRCPECGALVISDS